MTFTKITTAGAGTMGSQVAWQMAFHGKHVVVYDAIPAGLQNGQALHREYAEHFVEQRGATREQIDDTFARLAYTTDLAEAVRDADLISESVPESLVDQGVLLARGIQACPGPDRVHDQHLDAAAERAGGLRRPAAEVPGPALRHRRVGREHRRGHGPSRHRHGRVRAAC